MACGDHRVAFRVAILDPQLTVTQPRMVTAAAGYDAISHAVEAFVTTKRTAISEMFARDAWRLLEAHYERVMADVADLTAESAMLVGAHQAGVAIEQSMLGATHACANPLSARYGTTHGTAIAVMLPHVVRWNAEWCNGRYDELLRTSGSQGDDAPGERLARRLRELARIGGLPATLDELGVRRADLSDLAREAAQQWTGTFNPRPFDAAAALALYEAAY
jgi:alcohol dehydrogenase